MRKAMEEYGLKVKFDISEDWFSVVFPRAMQTSAEGAVRASTRKVPEKYQKIIDEIGKNPQASRKELAEVLGESEETIQSRLRKLAKDGVLKRVGPDKGGHWEVVKRVKGERLR